MVSGEESSKQASLEGFAEASNGKRTEARQMFVLQIETVAATVGRALRAFRRLVFFICPFDHFPHHNALFVCYSTTAFPCAACSADLASLEALALAMDLRLGQRGGFGSKQH